MQVVYLLCVSIEEHTICSQVLFVVTRASSQLKSVPTHQKAILQKTKSVFINTQILVDISINICIHN
jgi:hypothetical protein